MVGTATSAAGAADIQQALDAAGIAGWGAMVNVTEAAACEALVGEIEKKFGAVSVLVNNAGITRDNLAMRMKDDEWDQVIETNLKAGNPGQANYAAAKAGVAGMSRALAQELGSRNITVNCVAPGFIDTDMTRALPDAQRDALLGKIPLGRLGQPDEIAATVAFLASKSAGYITGTTLNVNGGMYMA